METGTKEIDKMKLSNKERRIMLRWMYRSPKYRAIIKEQGEESAIQTYLKNKSRMWLRFAIPGMQLSNWKKSKRDIDEAQN